MSTGDEPLDYEKLGVFYLGRLLGDDDEVGSEPLLYDARDLTTHGVVVGMTGSGKTGLSVGILEEAAIDGVPSLVIDPKGDMANLALTFPRLLPEDFAPWVDPSEAARRGQTVEQFAASTAKLWRSGLEQWGQNGARIERFQNAVDLAVYTPGSNAGIGLSVLRSFAAPTSEVSADEDALRERVQAAASGLLSLLGVEADPLQSREHILLSNLLDRSWRVGQDLDLSDLIRQVQAPPFDKLGVVDLETFFPQKDRVALAMRINGLLASPGFAAWMEGEALDVSRLLYTEDGRARISVISIAHLNDAERMFIVTLLLNEVVAWMRAQPGTSSLRALLYMDEIFGYFPPVANPPSKAPMLTLLKQARAYGLGVLLATQNPVDLDYKGLSNCGTWFIGRLQTERDRDRVVQGLLGASTQAGQALDESQLQKIMGSLDKRVFLVNNVHEDAPVRFHTRWVLSYLRGPLMREEIERLMSARKESAVAGPAPREAAVAAMSEVAAADAAHATSRPSVPPDVAESFLRPENEPEDGSELVYRPMLLGVAELHFKRSSVDVDDWAEVALMASIGEDARALDWTEVTRLSSVPKLFKRPVSGARFAPLAGAALRARSYQAAAKKLSSLTYRSEEMVVWKSKALKTHSEIGESERDFRIRVSQALAEERDREVAELRGRYAKKLETVDSRILSAQHRLEKEEAQYADSKRSTMVQAGLSVLSVLVGRKKVSVTNARRAGTTFRGLSRSRKEKEDIGHAEEKLEVLEEQKRQLEAEFQDEVTELQARIPESAVELESVVIRPTKSDTEIQQLALVWAPWSVAGSGIATPLFELGEPLDATSG